jgi:hypothetical protein
MKKTFTNSILISALFLVVGFFGGCIADTEIIDTPSDADRAVSLRMIDSPETRGTSPQIPNNTAVVFNTGHLYLVNSWGHILRHYAIVVSGGTIDANRTVTSSGIINRADLAHAEGVTIASVPGQATDVIVVGNYAGAEPLPVSGNISTVRRMLNVASQHDVLLPGVNLWGEDQLTHTSGNVSMITGNRIYDAHVELSPTVARFEIANIAATYNTTSTNTITSFRVEGIFMDQFFGQANIDGEINEGSRHTGGQIPNNFTGTSHTAAPILDVNNGIHDWYSPGLLGNASSTTALTVTPHTYDSDLPANTVWSYQVFAQSHDHTFVEEPPRIIIRLSDVQTPCNTFTGAQFVTVTGFTYSGGSLMSIDASHVYHISSISFNQTHLSPYPNPENIAVNVEITLARWNGRQFGSAEAELRQPNPQNATITAGTTHEFPLGVAIGGICLDPIEYRWEMSTNGTTWAPTLTGGTWNTNNAHLTTQPLNANTYFRRLARRCGDLNDPANWITTEHARVTIGSPLSQPTLLPLTICAPYTIFLGVATGAAGIITYRWEYSVNDFDWNPAPGINNAATGFYTIPGTLQMPVYLRRVAIWNGAEHFGNSALMSEPLRINFDKYEVINGITWATRNVDLSQQIDNPAAGLFRGFAPHPANHGMLFQWGHNTGFNFSEIDGVEVPLQRWNPAGAGTWEDVTPTAVNWQSNHLWGQLTWDDNPCPAGWRVPTLADLESLVASGYQKLTMATAAALGFGCHPDGGTLFGGGANPYVFFPVVRARCEGGEAFWNPMSQYWSNDGTTFDFANVLNVGDGTVGTSSYPHTFGNPVRCVRASIEQPNPISHWVPDGGNHTFPLGVATGGAGNFTYQWQSSLTGADNSWANITNATNATYTTVALTEGSRRWFRRVAISGGIRHYTEPAEISVFALSNVDLSTANGFAPTPQDPGMLFQWGRSTGWRGTGHAAYHWTGSGFVAGGWNSSTPVYTTWTTANDPCPSGWRVPNHTDFERLNSGTVVQAANGRTFGTAPNQLFMPSVGIRDATQGGDLWVGANFYWSSQRHATAATARRLGWTNGTVVLEWTSRGYGLSVRCVVE